MTAPANLWRVTVAVSQPHMMNHQLEQLMLWEGYAADSSEAVRYATRNATELYRGVEVRAVDCVQANI